MFGLNHPRLKPERFQVWFKGRFKPPLSGFGLNPFGWNLKGFRFGLKGGFKPPPFGVWFKPPPAET